MGMMRCDLKKVEALYPPGPQLHLMVLGRFTARSIAGQ